MELESLAQWLKSQGVGVGGVEVYRDHLPAQAKEAILVTTQTEIRIDPYSGLRKGRLQVIARSDRIDIARERMEAISALLDRLGLVVGSIRFLFIKPAHEPIPYPRSEGGGFEASVGFNFAFVNLS